MKSKFSIAAKILGLSSAFDLILLCHMTCTQKEENPPPKEPELVKPANKSRYLLSQRIS